MKKSDLEHYKKIFEREDAFQNTEEYKRSLEEELRKPATKPTRQVPFEEKDDIPF